MKTFTMHSGLLSFIYICTLFVFVVRCLNLDDQSSVGAKSSEPIDTKVVEISSGAIDEKDLPVVEHVYPAQQKTPIIIEESHDINPESDIELNSRRSIVVPMSPRVQYQGQEYAMQLSRPNTHFLLHVVPSHVRRRHESGIPDLLAILAPLAAIPLLGSLAVSSFTTMLTLTGLGRRRRKRETTLHKDVLGQLTSRNQSFAMFHLGLLNTTDMTSNIGQSPTLNVTRNLQEKKQANESEHESSFTSDLTIFGNFGPDKKTSNPISELFQLDVVQQYLRQSGRPDHNDQIIASYLACRGLFAAGNHCLERLACHYADVHNGRLKPLERDVAALIIYSLLRNSHIDSGFKRRLQRAALFGYDHMSEKSSSSFEASFVPVCDREFPCPKSEMP